MMRIFCQNLVVPLFLAFIGFEENDQGRYFPGRFVTLAATGVFTSAEVVFKFSVVWVPLIIGTVFVSILLCLTANRISAVVNARL
jgi:hypothetical protein